MKIQTIPKRKDSNPIAEENNLEPNARMNWSKWGFLLLNQDIEIQANRDRELVRFDNERIERSHQGQTGLMPLEVAQDGSGSA